MKKFKSRIDWSKITVNQKRIEYLILREIRFWSEAQDAKKKTISESDALKLVS